jgi:hypothetical protein
MEIVYGIAFWWTLTIWAVIGFLCWIPLLTRMTAVFSTMIIISAISQTNDDARILKNNFENAVGFYSRGFVYINQVLGRKYRNRQSTLRALERDSIDWGRVGLYLGYTALFWGSLFFVLSKLFSS